VLIGVPPTCAQLLNPATSNIPTRSGTSPKLHIRDAVGAQETSSQRLFDTMDRQLEHAVRHKKPVPEIDFTLHTMEDGTQVSTAERVCKGID
jgi:hypothetical protein